MVIAAKRIILGIGSLCLLVSQWAGADVFNDAGAHNIVAGRYDRIDGDNPAPPRSAFTTLTFGGTAQTDWLATFANSQVAINGGFTGELETHENMYMTRTYWPERFEFGLKGDGR